MDEVYRVLIVDLMNYDIRSSKHSRGDDRG